ncbi:MAG: 30S ribosomal protein S8 [Gammaproteobacteria bacterium]|nr:30S ribosomal protein S8 [Gammaproteobacteria bacterium]
MSMSDPLADMFTRIRNAQSAKKRVVSFPSSKERLAVLNLLKEEGYVGEYNVSDLGNNKQEVTVELRYFEGKPVIENIERISRPSRRVYAGTKDLPKIIGGLGVAMISTSKGLMSDRRARELGEGGEVIGKVS